MRVLHIDAMEQTVVESKATTLEEMQALVGGYIERAMTLPNGDEVFVNEEGLFTNPNYFFTLEGGHQPFCGNAYVIGATDEEGESTPAKSTVKEIEDALRFLGLKEF